MKISGLSFYDEPKEEINWEAIVELLGEGPHKTYAALRIEEHFGVVLYCWKYMKARGVMIYGHQQREAFLHLGI